MADLKKMYTTILGDHFPMEMTITFGDQKLVYRKKTWKIVQEDGSVDERGVRYGENPDQEAALYELVNGNLVLGDCRFIEPGNGLVSAINVEDMLQVGKHPGKINLTDIDNGLNIMKYLMDRPAVRHPQTQQSLRRGLRRNPGRCLQPGQPDRPHRRLWRGHCPEPDL